MPPIKLGDFLKEQTDAPPAVSPEFCTPLCNNCFHQPVCAVAHQITVVASAAGLKIAVGMCEAHMPVEDLEKDE